MYFIPFKLELLICSSKSIGEKSEQLTSSDLRANLDSRFLAYPNDSYIIFREKVKTARLLEIPEATIGEDTA